jgi:hypothetical protein
MTRSSLPSATDLNRASAALRSFARAAELERCDLCGATLSEAHNHLLDPGDRSLRCACLPCALLFDDTASRRWRRVERSAAPWTEPTFTDSEWSALGIPVGLCFFVRPSSGDRILAFYPGPAGVTEAQLSGAAWSELKIQHPGLSTLKADVEAVLVSRVDGSLRQARVSIDLCYHLVGLLRKTWRGFGGGSEAWRSVDTFFDSLELGHAGA